MKNNFLIIMLFLFTTMAFAQVDKVKIIRNDEGMKLVVNENDFMINGMNWDYIPIGTNTVNANFWKKPDDIIKAGLDKEMSLLKNMKVNVIRQYTGVPAKWIQYIYENYGIYTMLNDPFGRYGLTLDGVWTPVTDYSDARTQEFLLNEVNQLVEEYKNTPGLLMYLLGNENNYGLFWAGAETEDFPDDEEERAYVGEKRGRPMYRLINEAARIIKTKDLSHPVAMCNGDVLFIDIIAEECNDIDIYGVNAYRGVSFGNIFQEVKDKLNLPIMFTEFGADAFNAITNEEDQESQAYYLVGNWKEIYENAAGFGKANNSIGGFTFQFSDGWWKYGFNDRINADQHDNIATWSNGGYARDLEGSENNMNEEWFGICAKGPTNVRGLYDLYPRAAYYALKQAHQLNPYDAEMSLNFIDNYFDNISIIDAVLRARGDKAVLGANKRKILGISNFRAEFTTFNTGGSLITTPDQPEPDYPIYPNQLGFDHMESFYIGVEANPTANMYANVNVNIVGNVAENPIDQIFYETRSRAISEDTEDGVVPISELERVAVYNAEYEWNARDFDLRGFYRIGHNGWGYDGDFFGLYPEAQYGPNLDIYNGEILGFEVDGKRSLDGLTLAFGSQLWWGANPAVLLKYSRTIGKYDLTAVYHNDVAAAADAVSSIAIPLPETRRATLAVKREFGSFGIELGGMWGGQPLNGWEYQVAKNNPDYNPETPESDAKYIIYVDQINSEDNWGAKAKVTYSEGAFNWYAQGAVMGLVANGGADYTKTFTGWRLKDSGSGNQSNFLTGFTYSVGNLQIAPNFLWQKPIIAPMPGDVQPPGRLRNIQDDPFAVRANRETTAGELLLTYDPTPATWMYEWDNDLAEDAKFAVSADFVFRHLPTSQDAAIGILPDGRTTFAFPGAAPAQDLWETNIRMVSKLNTDFGLIANIYFGNGQANGSNPRLINRVGGDIRMIYKKMKLVSGIKINDWGPYDYHRDFNLTYPLQLMLDLSTSLGKPNWFILPNTKIGIRGTWRSLDQYSPRYAPGTVEGFATEPIISPVGFPNGSEWEIRTYVHINVGK